MGSPKIEKPLICQAGSAEAFARSPATGREQTYYRQDRTKSQELIAIEVFNRDLSGEAIIVRKKQECGQLPGHFVRIATTINDFFRLSAFWGRCLSPEGFRVNSLQSRQ